MPERSLAERGMQLILDFVPNHVAPDHLWATQHPDYFIQGSSEDLSNNPDDFIRVREHILACRRSPYFPAWSDVFATECLQSNLQLGDRNGSFDCRAVRQDAM